MAKILKIIFAFIVSWMFFFPTSFTFLPQSINSKLLLAVVGLLCIVYGIFLGRIKNRIHISFLVILIIAGLFSLISYVSTTINNTHDYVYTTYIASMLVWLSAGYVSFKAIRYAHSNCSVELISNYIIALCVVQCIMSLLIDIIPELNHLIRNYIVLAEQTSHEHRLIGVGVSFDPAGIRFSAALIICAAMLVDNLLNTKSVILYIISFFIILIIGNMLSRTTTIGEILAFLLIIYKSEIWKGTCAKGFDNMFKISVITLVIIIPVILFLYRSSVSFRELMDFGFEGVINYIRTGKWETNSTNILQGMWSVWPDSLKTWLIGDGYFTNPDNPRLYYRGTDVGYVRIIFYCGIIGLGIFGYLFLYLSKVFSTLWPDYSLLFTFLLILQLAVWLKVSTDIFLVFALYYPLVSQNGSLKTNNNLDAV